QVTVGRAIAERGHVALAIGDVFEHRRHRLAIARLRQPYACREPHAVAEGNPDVLDLADSDGQLSDKTHLPILPKLWRPAWALDPLQGASRDALAPQLPRARAVAAAEREAKRR